MAQYQDILNKFFTTIGTTSDYEVFKQIQQTDAIRLSEDIGSLKMSRLGTPVLDYVELVLEKDQYKDMSLKRDYTFSSNNAFKDKIKSTLINAGNTVIHHSINDKALHLNNTQVTLNRTANIVRTSINGMDGTFKEFYSNGDHIITLTGQLTGVTSLQDDLQNLRNFVRIFENIENDRIIITSRFLNNDFHIKYVVITDYSLDLNQDYSNVIDFTINLESDYELDIIYETK